MIPSFLLLIQRKSIIVLFVRIMDLKNGIIVAKTHKNG